ncbi:hypothetical protein [Deinococcus petrolearius]|uniref:Transmembrane protein n=1 Tax=Deinococcus petrolearius TaxID=1751295 RepID=A0ABW1DQ58_9DEIO
MTKLYEEGRDYLLAERHVAIHRYGVTSTNGSKGGSKMSDMWFGLIFMALSIWLFCKSRQQGVQAPPFIFAGELEEMHRLEKDRREFQKILDDGHKTTQQIYLIASVFSIVFSSLCFLAAFSYLAYRMATIQIIP